MSIPSTVGGGVDIFINGFSLCDDENYLISAKRIQFYQKVQKLFLTLILPLNNSL